MINELSAKSNRLKIIRISMLKFSFLLVVIFIFGCLHVLNGIENTAFAQGEIINESADDEALFQNTEKQIIVKSTSSNNNIVIEFGPNPSWAAHWIGGMYTETYFYVIDGAGEVEINAVVRDSDFNIINMLTRYYEVEKYYRYYLRVYWTVGSNLWLLLESPSAQDRQYT